MVAQRSDSAANHPEEPAQTQRKSRTWVEGGPIVPGWHDPVVRNEGEGSNLRMETNIGPAHHLLPFRLAAPTRSNQ